MFKSCFPIIRSRKDGGMTILTCRKMQVQSAPRARVAKSIRPFYQANGLLEGLLEAEFYQFVRAAQPVEVTVPDIAGDIRIALHDRECRRGDLFVRITQPDAYHLT